MFQTLFVLMLEEKSKLTLEEKAASNFLDSFSNMLQLELCLSRIMLDSYESPKHML